MEKVLELCNVSKIYGNRVVVNNASFSIEKGCVCGLLGPNGAGKTTIMKIIMNQIKCERGNVLFNESLKIKYLQDVPEFYEFYSMEEYLLFLLEVSHYSKNKEERVLEVLKMLNLEGYRDIQIKKLSRGLRQKVGIASVIVDEPDILILDEPVSALDPIGRKEMFDIILSLKGKVTIIFSSHILTDVERICDHIVLISNGKIVLDSSMKDIVLDKQTLTVSFYNRDDLLVIKEKVENPTRFSERIKDCLEIDGENILELQKNIFSLLSENKISVKCVAVKRESLEDIFLREVEKNG